MRRTTRIRRGLLSWLTNATLPVFVLDERRVVLFFNQGCEQLTGWTAADLIGQVCDYHSSGDPGSIQTAVSRLCPPPDVLAGRSVRVPAELLHRDGASHARTIHYFVLRESDDAAAHFIGIIGPRDADSEREQTAAWQQHADLAALFSRWHRAHGEHTLVGVSSAAHRLREQLKVAASCAAGVHLYGERGAGREQIARLIHVRSARNSRAFVPLDCDCVPPIELKLTLRRLLSTADQPAAESLRAGSVFLRSAGDLPRDVQELLLSERDALTALGWQLISCDDRRLSDLVAEHKLLPAYVDLLSELVIDVPALRARRDDLPLIAQHVLEALNRGEPIQVGGFTPEVWDLFAKYEWPGNVAELDAVIREARATCTTPLIAPRDLPFRFRTGMDAQASGPSLAPQPVDLEALLARVAADHIRWALAASKSNKSQAAALLGLTRPRLYRRMEALGIADEESPS
ncbi:MAG: sigma 54-interacting transcriptional regulator [Pirellulales bacterium]